MKVDGKVVQMVWQGAKGLYVAKAERLEARRGYSKAQKGKEVARKALLAAADTYQKARQEYRDMVEGYRVAKAARRDAERAYMAAVDAYRAGLTGRIVASNPVDPEGLGDLLE